MKKIFLLNFSLFFFLSFSQKGLVKYGYYHALTIGNAKAPESQAYLSFNKQLSYYVTAKESLEKAADRSEQKTYTNDEGGGSIYNGSKMSEDGDQVVNHLTKKTMWSNLLYRKQVYMKEVTPQMIWKIENETKKIGKFICKKATTNFRGRVYTAWFTTEIPLPYGPWKLQGLPGLILEAYDKGKFVYWYSQSVEYPSGSSIEPEYIKIPKNDKFLTTAEFQAFQNEELKRMDEKSKIVQKNYPDVKFLNNFNICEMFVECKWEN